MTERDYPLWPKYIAAGFTVAGTSVAWFLALHEWPLASAEALLFYVIAVGFSFVSWWMLRGI